MSWWDTLEVYAVNVWRAKDVQWNANTGGDREQTLSDRIGDKLRGNRIWAKIANTVFLGHFSDVLEKAMGKQIVRSSLGFGLASIGIIAWIYVRHRWSELAVDIEHAFYGGLLLVLLIALARHRGRLP